ncbi:MAG TPA: sugar phosphate nucleotidyltransferase [Kofleriaceae bacterium]|nr:sugar phosphate nucleotidyltransferase [Kofleriaceae bacterium]
MTLPVAILAGGLATRLGPITRAVPKALLDVAGKPFVVHQLALLRAAGIRRVVLCVAHLADQIEAVLGDGRDHGVEIAYSSDGDQLLGTGGALRRALPLLGDRFLVLYGDSYLTCDYAAIARAFVASGKLGLMTVFENHGQYDASNVRFRGGQGRGQGWGEVDRYDKTPGVPDMTHIDYGLGGFAAAAFAGYPAGARLDLTTVYQDLLARGELFGYEVFERFYEIGSTAGLEETRRLLSKETPA